LLKFQTNQMTRNICALIFIIFICSCSKNENVNDTIEEEQKPILLLLKERFKNETLDASYTYNPDSTLQSITTYLDGEERLHTTYEYDNDIIESTTNRADSGVKVSSLRYSNINSIQRKREQFNDMGQLISTSIYGFEDSSCGYVSIKRIDATNTLISDTRVDFIDHNCSSTFYKTNSGQEEYKEWEYIRNDKFDANNSTTLPFFGVDQLYGVTKLMRYGISGSLSTNLSYESSIEYNEENFPIGEIRTYLDGDIVEYTYTYY